MKNKKCEHVVQTHATHYCAQEFNERLWMTACNQSSIVIASIYVVYSSGYILLRFNTLNSSATISTTKNLILYNSYMNMDELVVE